MASHVINAVRSFLASKHMYVEDEWLTGCVEYLTEKSGGNLDITEIQILAKEQWLLNDLKDICPGCLPPNLAAQKKTILKGQYVLQINATLDVGTPAYQQYLKLQKVNMDNVEATMRHEDKVPNHRMIKLYLTDGEQDISAIEYKPMRNLNCEISPGTKVLIKGPVGCRRGVIQLTESSIELLGGDVADFASSNSLPALLAAKLGLSNPREADGNTAIVNQRNADIPTPHSDVPIWSPNQISESSTRPTATSVADLDDEIDIDQIKALEALIDPAMSESTSSNVIPAKTNANSGVFIDLDPVKRPPPSNYDKPEKKLKVGKVNNRDDYPDDIDVMIEEDEDFLREIDAKMDVYESLEPIDRRPKVFTPEPFVYIKHINELCESKKRGRVFRVKAQIIKLLSKLTVGKDGWCLKCTIVDGTGSLDAEFTSAVLSKLVGYTPEEMTRLKKEMATNPQLKETAMLALKNAKDTLQVLYCIIEITVQNVARITNLVPFEAVHVDLLKKRSD